ncbi:MAG: T9SS type A sorting domain-containing protein, partial [Sphingobacteriales bacterium]
AAYVARIAVDPAFRMQIFARGMKYPQFSVINNRLLYDAFFFRDYHGLDSTNFATGSSKNSDHPTNWSCAAVQNITDKNDILDMMMHVRRQGPNPTDSLWLFGGVSIENTTGDRYFDFELYQTDISYNKSTLSFSGYGPDAGHTTFKFDAAGNVIQPGDIILSANYGSSTLTSIEARIWIDKASLTATPNPANFSWTGTFDGASSTAQYGYAGIGPKAAGNFYFGVECVNSTWAGSFSLIRENNAVTTTYITSQYMEFGVNLSKIGLDPISLIGGKLCGLPFRKVLVKTRSSTSFTSELKDFIAPFDFFRAPQVQALAAIPLFCGATGVTDITVANPLSTSTYSWSTVNGRIVGSTTGPTITVDTTGTYIVEQRLLAACTPYAIDTVTVTSDPTCITLGCNILGFNASLNKGIVKLDWEAVCSQVIKYFEVERSIDGIHFIPINHVLASDVLNQKITYTDTDNLSGISSLYVYYRLKAVGNEADGKYSQVVKVSLSTLLSPKIRLAPNPVVNSMLVNIDASSAGNIQLRIYSGEGKLMKTYSSSLQKGQNTITLNGFQSWERGLYHVVISTGGNTYAEKIMVNN